MTSRGELSPADLVWTDGMSAWAPASTVVPEIFAPEPVASVMPLTPETPQAPVIQPPPIAEATVLPPAGTQVPNHLPIAILTTVCCCTPLGIVALVFAAQVNTKLAAGDYRGALEASRQAKLLGWIALWLGIAGWVTILVIWALQEFVV